MMNWIHAHINRPERGWDPVPSNYAHSYANNQWAVGVDDELLNQLESWAGGLVNKRVLDLGGGPGHYSVALAKRGAVVTWYDVSRTYQEYAEKKARENCVDLTFSLGYLDEATQNLESKFDLVFNRICFNYGWSDSSFAEQIFQLVKPGGIGYVDTTHSAWRRESLSLSARLRSRLNDITSIKIGHPFPPRGRLARLLANKAIEKLLVDYSSPHNDRVFFIRAKEAK